MANPQRKTVTQLLLAVRTNLDEATAGFWSDTRLIGYIDQAQHMVWSDVKKLKADYFSVSRSTADGASVTILGETYSCSGSLVIPVGTSSGVVTLPPDMAELHLVECITSGYEWVAFDFLPRTAPEVIAARQRTEGVSPSRFYVQMQGEKSLAYAPGSTVALDLRITYTPMLDTLATGTDTLQVPPPLWLAVVDYATARALMMDNSPSYRIWEASAQAHIARQFGGHARQTQDAVYVEDTF